MPQLTQSFGNRLLYRVSTDQTPILTLKQALKLYGKQYMQFADVQQLEALALKGVPITDFSLSDSTLEHVYINALLSQRQPSPTLALKQSVHTIENALLQENLRYLFGEPGKLELINKAFSGDKFDFLDVSLSQQLFRYFYQQDYYKIEDIATRLREDQLYALYDMLKQKEDYYLKELVDARLLSSPKAPLLFLLRNASADDCYFDVILQDVLRSKEKCLAQKEFFYDVFQSVKIRNYTPRAGKLKFIAENFFRRLFYIEKACTVLLKEVVIQEQQAEKHETDLLSDWLVEQDMVDFNICNGK